MSEPLTTLQIDASAIEQARAFVEGWSNA